MIFWQISRIGHGIRQLNIHKIYFFMSIIWITNSPFFSKTKLKGLISVRSVKKRKSLGILVFFGTTIAISR